LIFNPNGLAIEVSSSFSTWLKPDLQRLKVRPTFPCFLDFLLTSSFAESFCLDRTSILAASLADLGGERDVIPFVP
jgi:hypothetical protein